MRLLPIVSACQRLNSLIPQEGYHGNAFAFLAVLASAAAICGNPLGYIMKLVREAKAQMTEECLQGILVPMPDGGNRCPPGPQGADLVLHKGWSAPSFQDGISREKKASWYPSLNSPRHGAMCAGP